LEAINAHMRNMSEVSQSLLLLYTMH